MYPANPDELLRRRPIDAVATELAPVFSSEFAKNFSHLENALKEDARSNAADLCRRMNSAAALYGYSDLAKYLGQLETILRSGVLPPAHLLLPLKDAASRIMDMR